MTKGKARLARTPLQLLRDRKFATYWGGSFLSNIGTWMQQMAEPWLILNLTSSPVHLGQTKWLGLTSIWACFGSLNFTLTNELTLRSPFLVLKPKER